MVEKGMSSAVLGAVAYNCAINLTYHIDPRGIGISIA